MRNAYDLEDFTRSRVPDRNLLSSVFNGLVTGSTGEVPELCLPPDRDGPRQEQVYHKSTYLARGRRKPRRISPKCVSSLRRVFGSSTRLKAAVSAERSFL
jgi:hypothetical protein